MRLRYAMAALMASALSSGASAAPARYFVTFDSAESAAAAIGHVGAQGDERLRHLRHTESRGEVFEAPAGAEGTLRALPGVTDVRQELALRTMSDAQTPWFLGDGVAGIHLGDVWSHSRGAGVTIAVIDNGITSHSALDARIRPGYDFVSDETSARDGDGRDADPRDEGNWGCGKDSSWHGTGVAGVIAAATNGALMGVAPDAEIIPVRAAGACGQATELDFADAITWASGGDVDGVPSLEKPADIINVSMATAFPCDTLIADAVAAAIKRGAIIIAAAGNDPDESEALPAMCDGVIAVGALGVRGWPASYATRGPWVAVSAPGGEEFGPVKDQIWTTSNNGAQGPEDETEAGVSGSSFATPLVSGVVALMRSMKPDLTAAEARRFIVENARPGFVKSTGGGRLDASATVNALAASMN